MNDTIRKKRTAAPLRLHCLIVTALFDFEYESVARQLDDRVKNPGAGPKVERDTRHQQADLVNGIERWKLTFEGPKAHLCLGTSHLRRMGVANAAVEISRLVEFYSPNFVIMAGIAGSLKPNTVKLGDVVIGEFVRWEGYNKISPNGDCLDFRVKDPQTLSVLDGLVRTLRAFAQDGVTLPSSDKEYLKQFESLADKPLPANGIHVGGIMSWDYVLNHAAIRDAKHASVKPHVIAVDMESAGLLYALEGRSTKPIVFRGISDECDKKPDSESGDPWRQIAADNAVACMFRFLEVHGAALR